MIAEERELRRAGSCLRHVLNLQELLALRDRVTEIADLLQPIVELRGRDGRAVVVVGSINRIPDTMNVLA